MPIIIYQPQAVQQALKGLAQRLRQLFGAPVGEIMWSFPQGAVPDRLPTWSVPIAKNQRLILGLKPEFRWGANPSMRRCPFLLAIDQNASDGITPNVEINIPKPMRRNVNGCFAKDDTGNLWLYHRGSRLTAHGNQKIPKKDIHHHFTGRLVSAEDDGLINEFIPVVKLNSGKTIFKSSLTGFINEINNLKGTW